MKKIAKKTAEITAEITADRKRIKGILYNILMEIREIDDYSRCTTKDPDAFIAAYEIVVKGLELMRSKA
jgi:hypothetical protein